MSTLSSIGSASSVWNRLNSMEIKIPKITQRVLPKFEIDLIVWK